MHPCDRFIKWASSWACHGRHSNVHSSLAKKASRIPKAMGRPRKEADRGNMIFMEKVVLKSIWFIQRTNQIYFTKLSFMDSLLNEILSRLKITHGKGSSSVFCSGCTAFSSPKCAGLGSASITPGSGPRQLKTFTLRHKVTGTALLLAFHCSHSLLECILSNWEAISNPIPHLVLWQPVCGNHFEKQQRTKNPSPR